MDSSHSWIVVLGLAVGTFLIRYSFIGLFANRTMPPWLDRAYLLPVFAPWAEYFANCAGVRIVFSTALNACALAFKAVFLALFESVLV